MAQRSWSFRNPIGISTGWLTSKISTDLDVHNKVMQKIGATAVEMSYWEEVRQRNVREGTLEVPSLKYRALHLGSFASFQGELTTSQSTFIEELTYHYKRHKIQTATVHPNVIPSHLYRVFSDHGIRVGHREYGSLQGIRRNDRGDKGGYVVQLSLRAFSIFNTASKWLRI